MACYLAARECREEKTEMKTEEDKLPSPRAEHTGDIIHLGVRGRLGRYF
jgi:hypothetical protein